MPETLVDMFFRNAEKYSDKAALVAKVDGEYKEFSYLQGMETVSHLALGLDKLGVKKGDHVAILSENRPEWAHSDLAILSLGAVTIPVYPTLTRKQIEYILNNSESAFIFVSQPEHLETIEAVFNNLKSLKRIITFFDHGKPDSKRLLKFDDIVLMGEEHKKESPDLLQQRRSELNSTDIVSILYTSGTTGDPKGVLLSNNNFLSNIRTSLQVIAVHPEDVFLSFLPLCHIFERTVGYYIPLYVGGTIIYAESIQSVGENMREVHPTIMTSVPRLYEKMYNLVQDSVSKGSAVKKLIFKWCIRVGRRHYLQKKKGKVSSFTAFRYRIAEKLVFNKLRQRTGGNIRFFVSGGAPLAREIAEFFAYAGLIIVEGYGLTETSPIITANPLEDCRIGTVGKPIPGVEIKIADDGEILTRGPHVMQGYYENPEATKEVIDDEGWFATGDIGFIEDGYLTITDRKKNIIVTSGGKNIAPQPIENLMITSRYIEQIVMLGDRRQFPTAIVVPALENLKDYYQMQNITFKSRKEMVRDARTYGLIENEIERLSVDLSQYEKIKKFILRDEEFTQENGDLTPTLKIKRNIVEKKYAREIDKLYVENATNSE
ncbi:AMP-dependent synthetase/ligase [candidate division KSB1 bacterium]